MSRVKAQAFRPRSAPPLREIAASASELASRFDLQAVIGAGGVGVVLSARDRETTRRVAIKVLRDTEDLPPATVTRMLREARVMSALRSPYVVRVYEVGQLSNGSPYLVMEYLDGVDLAVRLRMGPLAVPVAVDVLMQACAAMAEAHQAGIVHRDLKPSNLFLVHDHRQEPMVKVLDFGIARETKLVDQEDGATVTASGVALGSPGYMAPEQVRGASSVDARADVWALGLILYEALSGVAPFRGDHAADSLVRIVSEAHVPLRRLAPSIPEGLAGVVEMCLEKDRDRRLPSVVDLVRGLAPYASSRSAEARIVTLARDPLGDRDATITVAPNEGSRRVSDGAIPSKPSQEGPTRETASPGALVPRVITCADRVAIAEIGPVCVSIFYEKHNWEKIDRFRSALMEALERHPQGMGLFSIIQARAKVKRPPEPGPTKALMEVLVEASPRLTGIATVIEIDGFMGALVRAVFSGMLPFRPRRLPVSHFRDARAAAQWLSKYVPLGSVDTFLSSVEQVRAMLEAMEA
jgi:serine/threonine-protein kinase